MDYKQLLIGGFLAVAGFCTIVHNLRKGWQGFRNENASHSQRRTDLLGGLVFSFGGLIMLVLGAFLLIETPRLASKPNTMAQTREEILVRQAPNNQFSGTEAWIPPQTPGFSSIQPTKFNANPTPAASADLKKQAVESRILANLRKLDAATDAYFQRNPTASAATWNNIGLSLGISAVDGEDYSKLAFRKSTGGTKWEVTSKGGVVVTYHR